MTLRITGLTEKPSTITTLLNQAKQGVSFPFTNAEEPLKDTPKEDMILIGTPAYSSQLHIDWHHSVMQMVLSGIRFKTLIIGNDSLVCRARNDIASYFLNNYEFSRLLFLDADIGISAQDVKVLLDHNKDVIAAPVSHKSERRTVNYLGHDGNHPAKVQWVGTGAMMVSRKAVKAVAEMSDEYFYYGTDKSKPMATPQKDIFQVGVVDGMYLSEDQYFCHKLAKAGFDIFVDTSIKTTHSGMHRFQL